LKVVNDTCVYILRDCDGDVLYVGITNNHGRRIEQHFSYKEWAKDVSGISVSEYMNRNQAHIYEIYYISILQPKYNEDFNKLSCDNFKLALGELIFNTYSREIRDFTTFNKSLTNEVVMALKPSSCKLLMFLNINKDSDGFVRIDGIYPSATDLQLLTDLSKPTYQKALRELKKNKLVTTKSKRIFTMIQVLV